MEIVSRMTLACFWAVLLLCGRTDLAQQPQASKTPTPRELFDQLNNLSIDPPQIYVLRDAQISRDRVKIYFNQGFIGSLSKVSREPTRAFFSGEGEVLLIPP